MVDKKYVSPHPARQITGNDFNELVDCVNNAIENSDLSQTRLDEISTQIKDFDERIKLFNEKIAENEQTIKKIHSLDARIDNFYSKIIEIVGIFIAIFSFIIASIHISFKAEGTFFEIIVKSSAIFIPLTISIGLLLIMIKLVIRK